METERRKLTCTRSYDVECWYGIECLGLLHLNPLLLYITPNMISIYPMYLLRWKAGLPKHIIMRRGKKRRPLAHSPQSQAKVGRLNDRQFIILLKSSLHDLVIYRAEKGIQQFLWVCLPQIMVPLIKIQSFNTLKFIW